MPQPVAVVVPVLMIVAKAVAGVWIFTDRLAGRTDARSCAAADAGQPRIRIAAIAATAAVTGWQIRIFTRGLYAKFLRHGSASCEFSFLAASRFWAPRRQAERAGAGDLGHRALFVKVQRVFSGCPSVKSIQLIWLGFAGAT